MKKNQEVIINNIKNIINMKATRIFLGHGSFLSIDFGKLVKVKVHSNREVHVQTRGEWHLWIYMCCWRIDRGGDPLVGSNDSQDKIRLKLSEIQDIKLINFEILNNSLDLKLSFENNVAIWLFNCNTEEDEHWMLFTPDHHVLTAGPANQVFYGSSS